MSLLENCHGCNHRARNSHSRDIQPSLAGKTARSNQEMRNDRFDIKTPKRKRRRYRFRREAPLALSDPFKAVVPFGVFKASCFAALRMTSFSGSPIRLAVTAG
jgi:hypothetical protein